VNEEMPAAQTDPPAQVIPIARPASPAEYVSLALPPEPPSLGAVDLLIGVAIVWAADFLIGGLEIALMLFSGGDLRSGEMPDLSPLTLIGLSLTSALFAVFVSWHFVCVKYRKRFKSGFAILRVSGRTIAGSVLLGVGGAIVGMFVLGQYANEESFMAKLISQPGGLEAICLLGLLVPPLEEIYYRGFIFSVLQKKLGAFWAIVIVTAWFGGAHAFQLAGDWVGFAMVVCMGGLWTLLRHYTRSLWPSIIAHWVYNTLLTVPALLLGN
jgi:membrane protease YdiL (CAAX protease family)